MRVVVYQTHFYDWERVPEGVKVTEDDFKAMRARVLHDNSVGMRVLKPAPDGLTHTEFGIPEASIEDCMKHFERVGTSKTRSQTVAFLVEKALPGHGKAEHITKVEVHDEPEVEQFLNNYFVQPAKKAGGAA